MENLDKNKFKDEDYGDEDHTVTDTQTEVKSIGEIESLQWEMQDKRNYSEFEKLVLQAYKSFFYEEINAYLWEGKLNSPFSSSTVELNDDDTVDLSEFDYGLNIEGLNTTITYKEFVDNLSDIIGKSPRLQENSILYHTGKFDTSLEVGKSGVLKGFTSASFNEDFSRQWYEESGGIMIKMYAPKNTKGIAIDGITNVLPQNEFLLDKGQKYVVVSKDLESKPPVVEILLY